MPIVTAQKEVINIIGNKLQNIESASLALSKLILLPEEREKEHHVAEICSIINKKKLQPRLHKKIKGALRLTAKLASRFMINQASGVLNGVLEVDRFFGHPVIPGSAIKGVCSYTAWCLWKEAEENEKEQISRNIIDCFGFPIGEKEFDDRYKKSKKENAGNVAFLSAYPINTQWNLVEEILTPHESDTKNPIPIKFPVVDKGAVFSFMIAPLRQCNVETLQFALKILETALTENGIGAKTANGYGRFKEIKQI